MLLDGSNVNFLVAFVAGVITFFASCLLPLVPTYLVFLAGIATNAKKVDSSGRFLFKREIIKNSVLFTLGFIIVFVLLGATASAFGKYLSIHRNLIQAIGGIFFVIAGLFMLGFLKSDVLLKEHKADYSKYITKLKWLNALIFGATFGFAWTPCIGPVLAVILFWASQAESAINGTLLLLAYGLGLGMPFIFVGVFFEVLSPKLSKASKFGFYLNKVASIVIILIGILLILGKVQIVSFFLLELFGLNSLAV